MSKFREILNQQYEDFGKFSMKYWSSYGGWTAFLSSPFVHFSLFITFFSYWRVISRNWWDIPLTVIPSVLGFSIASYAVIFSLSSNDFMKKLSGGGKEGAPSPYVSINTTYVHFLVMQLAALIFSILYAFLIGKPAAEYSGEAFFYLLATFSVVGFFLFIYALLSSLGAIKVIYLLAVVFDATVGRENSDTSKPL